MDIRTFIDLAIHDRSTLVARARRSQYAASLEDARLRLLRPFPGVTSRVHLCVLGMRRSGNHAFIEWMLAKGQERFGSSVSLNNLPLHENGFRHRLWYPEELSRSQHEIYEQCRWKKFPKSGLGLLIRSYEDISAAQFNHGLRNDFYYGQAERFLRAIVLRDPLNLFASRITSGKTRTKVGSQVDLFLDHLAALDNDKDLICLDFNRFIEEASDDYRSQVLDRVGLVGADATVHTKVSKHGGGSSFGDAQVSSLKLTTRFLSLRGDAAFEAIRNDPRIERIVREHYPEIHTIAYTNY